MTIPSWDAVGVLPPINSSSPVSTERSPYEVALTDVVLRFGTSPERQKILTGFLSFRSALHAVGLMDGFQWVNGSFTENVEIIEMRHPADIDTVTFFHMPPGETQETLLGASPRLFNPVCTKDDYSVDAYFVQLTQVDAKPLVHQSTYWYSLWSHRRNGQWKGYLEISLCPDDDQVAHEMLKQMRNEET